MCYDAPRRPEQAQMGREAAMIDALQQVVSQFETLSPEYQAQLAEEIINRLTKYQGYQADQARVSRMSKSEFAAFLAERQVSKPYLAPGYRGIYRKGPESPAS
jgi:hypothetical protein